MNPLPFIKMHGLGNDFVIIDARQDTVALSPESLRRIADRKLGVGFDQLIRLEPARRDDARLFMRIFNADGGEVEACGNASRCVARLIMEEDQGDRVRFETGDGLLEAWRDPADDIAVDMGPIRTGWRDIPLAAERDTLHLGISAGPLSDPVGISVGNPHAVFFVDDVNTIPLDQLGPGLEHHDLFPARANVEAVQVLAPDRLRVRVWERGVGITRACGTGACASLAAAHLRGLTGRRAEVILDGGPLGIEWREDGHVILSGPTAVSFRGAIDPSLLAGHD